MLMVTTLPYVIMSDIFM